MALEIGFMVGGFGYKIRTMYTKKLNSNAFPLTLDPPLPSDKYSQCSTIIKMKGTCYCRGGRLDD